MKSYKSFFAIVVVSLWVIQVSLLPLDESDKKLLYDQLYYSVINGEYDNAINWTLNLENNDKGDVIKLVVDKLLAEKKSSLIDYAYKLKKIYKTTILDKYFPIDFDLFLDNWRVVLINKRDEKALKLEWKVDSDGDRGVFGDINDVTSERVTWYMQPQWINNKVYFKILNKHRNQYLKVEVKSDNVNDHKAFGSNEHDSARHLWYLQPVVSEGQLLYFFVNKEYNQALKLGRDVDGDGDRRAWSHNGFVLDNPEHYAWHMRFNGS